MPDLVFYTTYPAADASSRRRVYAVAEELGALGHTVRVSSLLSESLYARKNARGIVARLYQAIALSGALLHRAIEVLSHPRHAVAVVHREAFPFLTPWFEARLAARAAGFFLDVDDGLHVDPPSGRDWRSMARSPQRFLEVVELADLVTVASPALLQAYSSRAHKLQLALTSPDPHIEVSQTEVPRRDIVWIGSQSTLSNIEPYVARLADVAARSGGRLIVVGGANVDSLPPHPHILAVRWTLEAQADALNTAAVGVMPLSTETEWDRYKGGYKLLLYLSAGVPCVASPVGVNSYIADQCGEAVCIAKDDEIIDRVAAMLSGPPDRRVVVMARGWVRSHASPSHHAELLHQALD